MIDYTRFETAGVDFTEESSMFYLLGGNLTGLVDNGRTWHVGAYR